jgi:hypothetical protein
MEFRSPKAARNNLDNITPLEKLSVALSGVSYPAVEKMLAASSSPKLLEGHETLSEPFKYELLCLSPDAFIPLERLLGQDVHL